MKKIVIILGGVTLIGAGIFMFSLRSDQGSQENQEPTPAAVVSEVASVEPKPFSGSESLSYLLGLGQDLECSIEFVDELASSTVTGTYFTSAGKFRGDFVVPTPIEVSVSSMILRDNTLYSWTTLGGTSYGMQIDLDTRAQVVVDETAPDTNEVVPLDMPIQYSCKSWVAKDESIFEPPRDILFKDYAALMEQGMEDSTLYGGSVGELPSTSPCALCEQVEPGVGQDECKARFQCQ